jgi:beta-glucosidase
VLAPTVNIMRIPTWGRNFETYSEDPYLAGVMGVAYVQGLQGEGVGASLKHYAANNQELERFAVDARVDERTLREIYLAAFERVVREADPWTVMASYNRLNGTYASEHRCLLTDILKDEWGYAGMVVSDWTAVRSTAPAANAGLDLEMPGPARWFGDKLLAAVEAGEVSPERIEDNARRVVHLILRAGLLDGPRTGRRTAHAAPPHHRLRRRLRGDDPAEERRRPVAARQGPPHRRAHRPQRGAHHAAGRWQFPGGHRQRADAGRPVCAISSVRASPSSRRRAATTTACRRRPTGASSARPRPATPRGSGLSTSPARIFAGEPTSAGLERHLVRWVAGTMATRQAAALRLVPLERLVLAAGERRLRVQPARHRRRAPHPRTARRW